MSLIRIKKMCVECKMEFIAKTCELQSIVLKNAINGIIDEKVKERT